MHQSTLNVSKYRFDRVFAAPAAAPGSEEKADLAARAAILQAELDLMRDERDRAIALARSEGYQAGLAEARAERETATLSAIDALQSAVEELDLRLDEAVASATADAADLAMAAAEYLAAQTIALAPGRAIDDAIGRVLKQVARGTELKVRVHPELAPEIERLVEERISQERRRLVIHVFADATVAAGDALIGWDEGGLSLSVDARRAALAEELQPLLDRA